MSLGYATGKSELDSKKVRTDLLEFSFGLILSRIMRSLSLPHLSAAGTTLHTTMGVEVSFTALRDKSFPLLITITDGLSSPPLNISVWLYGEAGSGWDQDKSRRVGRINTTPYLTSRALSMKKVRRPTVTS